MLPNVNIFSWAHLYLLHCDTTSVCPGSKVFTSLRFHCISHICPKLKPDQSPAIKHQLLEEFWARGWCQHQRYVTRCFNLFMCATATIAALQSHLTVWVWDDDALYISLLPLRGLDLLLEPEQGVGGGDHDERGGVDLGLGGGVWLVLALRAPVAASWGEVRHAEDLLQWQHAQRAMRLVW